MERTQIYLAPEQQKELKKLAAREHTTVSALIRKAIDDLLEEQQAPHWDRIEDHPLWGIVGIASGDDMPTDGSINHDRYLYGRPRSSF